MLVLILGLASPAFAEETNTAPPETFIPPAGMPMRKPLDIIRERALNAQQNIQETARDARLELKMNTKLELQNASGTERRDVLRAAGQERIEIMKTRAASSTALQMKMRAAIQLHGGQIRMHFSNAVRHLRQFMDRIESRMDKLAASGADISALITLQAQAETSIAAAELDIKAVQDFMATVTDDSDRAQVKATMESLIKDARESIRAAHEDVRALIKALVATKPTASVETRGSATIE